MAKPVHFIYDDRAFAVPPVSDLVGRRPFGEIRFRRAALHRRVAEVVGGDARLELRRASTDEAFSELLAGAREAAGRCLIWRASTVAISDRHLKDLLERIVLGSQNIVLQNGQTLALFANSATDLLRAEGRPWQHDFTAHGFEPLDVTRELVDLTDYRSCLRYLSGGFDARHFNNVQADGNTVVKRSDDVPKIVAEHDYYHLLPQPLRRWFVAPYNLSVADGFASYEMERLYIADMSLQWTHGSLSVSEFRLFLQSVFAFLDARPKRRVPKSEAEQHVQSLYVTKVDQRVAALKAMEPFKRAQELIGRGGRYSGLDDVLALYRRLLSKHESALLANPELTIGHGDLCFSNMLFERNTAMLKLIDPKGAREESALWTHASYDLAKLSHSVLGDYDWINNGLYRIEVAARNELELEILSSGSQLAPLKQTFVRELESRGLDLRVIRICEASLFLSMLPLHIDQPNKVLALLLNAIDILEELELNE